MLCILEQNEIDKAAMLYADSFNVSADAAMGILEGFAGTVFAFKENSSICGIICASPVAMNEKKGILLHAGATAQRYRRNGIFKALLSHAMQSTAPDFYIACNTDGYEEVYEALKFEKACEMRRFKREIKKNIWAGASFDTVTAKKLCEYRKKYISKNYVQLTSSQASALLTSLYSKGISTAETDKAYAMYYRLHEKLLVTELYAENEADAWYLLQAIADKASRSSAELLLSSANAVFAGEGSRFYSTMAFGLEINELHYTGFLPD